ALGLEQPTSGRVHLHGTDLTGLGWRATRPLRRAVQLVHQNPFAALDPRFTVAQSIGEPLSSFRVGDRRSRSTRVRELLDHVALAQVPHTVSVLRRGVVVEEGPVAEVFGAPESAYTRELIAAIPGQRLMSGRAHV